jgi:hypothetical protein
VITNEFMIKPLGPGRLPIHEAAECYRQWQPDVRFEEDLALYLNEGFVISSQRIFAVVRVIEGPRTRQPAWFIRMCVGPLDELASVLPFWLPEICLCRGKKGDLRVRSYSMERLIQLTRSKLYGRWRSRWVTRRWTTIPSSSKHTEI